MITRCTNEKATSWPNYGGRGIRICERWMVFENFLADMGERPSGTTLDRRDTYGNYDPENCRWGTLIDQGRNQRTNRLLEFKGEIRCLSEWSEKFGLLDWQVQKRLARGWSLERALTEPLRPYPRRARGCRAHQA